jgi:hypothetical protein
MKVLNFRERKLKCWQIESKPKQRASNIPFNFKSQMWHRVISHFLWNVLQGLDYKRLSCLLSIHLSLLIYLSQGSRTQKHGVKNEKRPGAYEDVYHFSKTSIYLSVFISPSLPQVLGPFPEALMDEKRPGTCEDVFKDVHAPFPSLFKPNVLRLGENSPPSSL